MATSSVASWSRESGRSRGRRSPLRPHKATSWSSQVQLGDHLSGGQPSKRSCPGNAGARQPSVAGATSLSQTRPRLISGRARLLGSQTPPQCSTVDTGRAAGFLPRRRRVRAAAPQRCNPTCRRGWYAEVGELRRAARVRFIKPTRSRWQLLTAALLCDCPPHVPSANPSLKTHAVSRRRPTPLRFLPSQL
mgnify:FL=1